ncbi:MAG: PilZ domain-containing protein [Terriglobia bacterium]
MTIERRRSDRLLLTVPLRVRGVDENGDSFERDAQTVDISRHGARIKTAQPLASGQHIRVTNLVNRHEASFRVAGPLAPMTEKGGEFGVMGPIARQAENQEEWSMDSLDPKSDLWGIRFPPPPPAEDSEPKALLACRQCSAAELVRLSLIEVDVLETAGIFSRFCSNCAAVTPWGFGESELVGNNPKDDPPVSSNAASPAAERRRHRRALLQLPALIRDYFGGVEIVKSENVSKGGVCFATEKNYHLGEGVMVECPYDRKSQNLEVPAQIVSRQEIPRSHRKVYGVKYKNRP